jgi:hypothetical protein
MLGSKEQIATSKLRFDCFQIGDFDHQLWSASTFRYQATQQIPVWQNCCWMLSYFQITDLRAKVP